MGIGNCIILYGVLLVPLIIAGNLHHGANSTTIQGIRARVAL